MEMEIVNKSEKKSKQNVLKSLKYSSSINSFSFLFLETKKFAKLLCEGKSYEDILELSINNNIFQLENEKRRRRVPLIIIQRLNNLNNDLINILASYHDDTAKLIVFLALIKTDKLLFEFMWEVYKDKFLLKQFNIESKDFIIFFENKSNQSVQISKWSENNIKKIISTYKTILCQANLCQRKKKDLKIIKPICDDIVLAYIKNDKNNNMYIEAMLLS